MDHIPVVSIKKKNCHQLYQAWWYMYACDPSFQVGRDGSQFKVSPDKKSKTVSKTPISKNQTGAVEWLKQ
jgi:hypothetical protein